MVQFLSIIFFSWISSVFVGFFKSSLFFVTPYKCARSKALNAQTKSSPLPSGCPLDLHCNTDCGKLRTEQTRFVM